MEAHKSALQIRLEMLEAEIADIKRRLAQPSPVTPPVTLEGLWQDIEVTDEELEEITHPQRVIQRLREENEALRNELERLKSELSTG